ncbi:UNVERIFIED_CONTAM: Fatty alcohol:caffeoyl-CoA acyltransferase [Sesamum latifolium]|uniref:Fatty alcohol:caffeoyl-CoA acyltransferase n=1 Tax=Sesamum latifolium TaxID=2727402 RepID=A0AAW2WRM4_9LAMI
MFPLSIFSKPTLIFLQKLWLKMALERVLVHYDFLAGRFKLNPQSGRLEIDCNSAELVSWWLLQSVRLMSWVTSFKCGGFSIGMSMNHVLLDSVSAQIFIENLATQAFYDKPLAIIPCNDRHLLAARSPPHGEFPHPELFELDLPAGMGPLVLNFKGEESDYTVFSLTSDAINYLKDKATESISSTTSKITVFSVVAALMWRCKALSNYTEHNKARVSTLLNVVDLRSRLNPPLPNSYCGNAILGAASSATCEDIEKWPFSRMVEMVVEAPERVTDEYAKSVIDCLEINKRPLRVEYMVNSWLRMRFGEVVYPWGKPVHSGPVVSHMKEACWIFPDVDGVNALVSLPAKEMKDSWPAFVSSSTIHH